MAAEKFYKGSEEWQVFQDYWKLCQDFWIPEGNDSYWEQAIEAASAFCHKYRDSRSSDYVRRITFAFLESLDEKARKENNEQDA